jgi:hypothetical protein
MSDQVPRQSARHHRGVDLISDALPFGRLWLKRRPRFVFVTLLEPGTVTLPVALYGMLLVQAFAFQPATS